jgi:hypothetical protein
LEDITPVQIHHYFHRVGNVDVKNSEAHPSILQLHIVRLRDAGTLVGHLDIFLIGQGPCQY